MAKPTKPIGSESRPRLRPQPGTASPTPKAIDHLRPHLRDAQGLKPTLKKVDERPKLR
jgi:hypothetical protein